MSAGRRASPGQIQTAVSDVLLARLALAQAAGKYSGLKESVQNSVTLFKANVNRHSAQLGIAVGFNTAITTIEVIDQVLGSSQDVLEA